MTLVPGVAGGSIVQGVLRVGDEIEIRPGIVTKDPEGNVRVRIGHSYSADLFSDLDLILPSFTFDIVGSFFFRFFHVLCLNFFSHIAPHFFSSCFHVLSYVFGFCLAFHVFHVYLPFRCLRLAARLVGAWCLDYRYESAYSFVFGLKNCEVLLCFSASLPRASSPTTTHPFDVDAAVRTHFFEDPVSVRRAKRSEVCRSRRPNWCGNKGGPYPDQGRSTRRAGARTQG